MRLTHAVFDVDDTLYPRDCGLWDALAANIDRFMLEIVGIPPGEVSAQRMHYYRNYGTTLNGLLHDYPDLDRSAYLQFVHAVPYEQYLRPDPVLDTMLSEMPLKLAIFTNADTRHAERVLEHLGIRRHFDTFVDIIATGFVNKPRHGAYRTLFRTLGAQPHDCVLVEDSIRNIKPARELGMTTVRVGASADDDDAHFQVESVHAVGAVISRLLA